MTDQNECRFTGTVEKFQVIETKTGTSMIKFFLQAGKEKVAVVAFRDLADQTRLSPGDRVAVLGALQSTSYKGQDGVMRYGYQVIASEITSEDEAPASAPPARTTPAKQATPPPGERVPIQPYVGGPF
jgi:single-stranded DNA-binding protein